MINKDRPAEEYWFCIMGPANLNGLPSGLDGPMRRAVETCFREITGHNADFCSSGWGISKDKVAELLQTLYKGGIDR